MTDAELVDELRWHSCLHPPSAEAADRLDALALQLVGEEKARHLLLKGMESQCELMDGLKQEARKLAAERDAAVARVAELEAGLREFKTAWDTATSGFDGLSCQSSDNLEAASELAAELLAGEGGGR